MTNANSDVIPKEWMLVGLQMMLMLAMCLERNFRYVLYSWEEQFIVIFKCYLLENAIVVSCLCFVIKYLMLYLFLLQVIFRFTP